MNTHNLLISTGTGFEDQATNELWFNLLGLGDEHPIITSTGVMGLVLVKTSVEGRKVVNYFQDSERQEIKLPVSDFNKSYKQKDGGIQESYVQFIKKIIPIDRLIRTDIDEISRNALDLVKNSNICNDADSKFRITIRKRHTNLETKDIIPPIADNIQNKVDLQNYDWVIQIEIIGDQTGVSILKPNEIFEPLIEKT